METDRQRHRVTKAERQTDRQTDREADRCKTYRQAGRSVGS